MKLPIYIGGGINNSNAKKIIDKISPNGLDVSRGLKDTNNDISLIKLNELRISLIGCLIFFSIYLTCNSIFNFFK